MTNRLPEAHFDASNSQLPDDSLRMPLAEGIQLKQLGNPGDDRYSRRVYVFDAPELEDKYVVRRFDYASPKGPLPTLAQEFKLYQQELARLRGYGVAIPHVYAALPGKPLDQIRGKDVDYGRELDIMLVAERIHYVEADDDQALLTQARLTVGGLARYLRDSWSPQRRKAQQLYLDDVFADPQVVFGAPYGRSQVGSYMVDVGAEFGKATNRPNHTFRDQRSDLLDTAEMLGEWFDDPGLPDHCRQLVDSEPDQEHR